MYIYGYIYIIKFSSFRKYVAKKLSFCKKISNSSYITLFFLKWSNINNNIAQSAGTVEYTDCTSAEG